MTDKPWHMNTSPPCPWCGEEITDSPFEDLPVGETWEVECCSCGRAAIVDSEVNVEWRATRVIIQPIIPSGAGGPR